MESRTEEKKRLRADHVDYVKKHNVDKLLAGLLQDLVIAQPADPLQFLVDLLSEPDDHR